MSVEETNSSRYQQGTLQPPGATKHDQFTINSPPGESKEIKGSSANSINFKDKDNPNVTLQGNAESMNLINGHDEGKKDCETTSSIDDQGALPPKPTTSVDINNAIHEGILETAPRINNHKEDNSATMAIIEAHDLTNTGSTKSHIIKKSPGT